MTIKPLGTVESREGFVFAISDQDKAYAIHGQPEVQTLVDTVQSAVEIKPQSTVIEAQIFHSPDQILARRPSDFSMSSVASKQHVNSQNESYDLESKTHELSATECDVEAPPHESAGPTLSVVVENLNRKEVEALKKKENVCLRILRYICCQKK